MMCLKKYHSFGFPAGSKIYVGGACSRMKCGMGDLNSKIGLSVVKVNIFCITFAVY